LGAPTKTPGHDEGEYVSLIAAWYYMQNGGPGAQINGAFNHSTGPPPPQGLNQLTSHVAGNMRFAAMDGTSKPTTPKLALSFVCTTNRIGPRRAPHLSAL
jgi:hypothetical protein